MAHLPFTFVTFVTFAINATIEALALQVLLRARKQVCSNKSERGVGKSGALYLPLFYFAHCWLCIVFFLVGRNIFLDEPVLLDALKASVADSFHIKNPRLHAVDPKVCVCVCVKQPDYITSITPQQYIGYNRQCFRIDFASFFFFLFFFFFFSFATPPKAVRSLFW